MGAKVSKLKGGRDWWLVIHHDRRRKVHRYGPLERDRRAAEKAAAVVNAQIAGGTFAWIERETGPRPLPCDAELRAFLRRAAVSLRPSTVGDYKNSVERHLIPHFGSRDLRDITRDDLSGLVSKMVGKGLKPDTVRNALAVLRSCCSALVEAGELQRNPVHGAAKLIRGMRIAQAAEVEEAVCWTGQEAATLIGIAEQHEPGFAPLLRLALGTGMRLGELRGLHWSDVNLDAGELRVRRSVADNGEAGPTKTARGRTVQLSPGLSAMLGELLALRRRGQIENGWASIPAPVFCTATGAYNLNIDRAWDRVRRRAQAEGVRPLKFHATRHTFASHALASVAPVPWVAAQGGWSDPSTLLRIYAHAIPRTPADLSFADYGQRHQTAPRHEEASPGRS